MVQADPQKRPTIEQVASRFEEVRSKLSWWKLRSRLVDQRESFAYRVFMDIGHIFRTAKYVAKRLPPVPTPS